MNVSTSGSRPWAAALWIVLASCRAGDTPSTGPGDASELTDEVCVAASEPSVRFYGPDTWPSPACRVRATELVAAMTLEEKAAQMLQPDTDQLAGASDLSALGFGSVLAGGNSGPKDPTPAHWADALDDLHHAAAVGPHAIPILFGIDAVHGHNKVKGAVIYPHNIGLGATRDPALLERIARATAEDVRATGMNWVFAPVLAAVHDERWGRTYEAFSEDPELVTTLGAAVVRGLQGPALGQGETSVLACAKHFIGDGVTDRGVDQGNALLTDEAVRERLLSAYRNAIATGVGSVMVSYSSLRGTKMHCNGPWVTDVLKRELGFNGIVVSDWEAVEKVPGDYPDRLAEAVNAGLDMIMRPKDYPAFVPTLVSLVPERIPEARIDDAVARILSVKCELGLVPADGSATRPTLAQRDKLTLLRSPARTSLGREAVRKSLVLLKNEGGVLPLDKGARVHVAGKNADDLGHQCGGWCIGWQGSSGPITEGTTILGGIQALAGNASDVTFSPDGSGAEGASVGVVVIGETPYAETQGDRDDLALDPADVAVIEKVRAAGIPVVVVLVTGRPLVLGDALDRIDALLVAWLPGTEGGGVADVLFGDHAPTGKLGFTWPRSMEQIPIDDRGGGSALFPFGFGLGY